MFRTRLYLFILCVVGFYSASNAQGYRAGDIAYKWLYGNTYAIKYTTYTTNGSDTYQCSIDSACFGDGTHAVVLRSNGGSTMCSSPARDGIAIFSTIKMNEYATSHTYSGSGNFIICFDGANRNAGIINIPSSVFKTMSIESSLIISPLVASNSSPTFANLPIAYGCLSTSCFTYNPMASDINGDSLAYKLIACTDIGGSPIGGYVFPSGGAGGTFSINPVTGTITWCNPQLTGDYNVKIKIEEWRKDLAGMPTLIGYVFRETQFIISTCTGLKENNNDENNFSIFPNPTNGILNFDIKLLNEGKTTIQILNTLGEILKIEHVSLQNPTLNIEDLNTGIYFLKITGNNNTNIIKKIIKQ